MKTLLLLLLLPFFAQAQTGVYAWTQNINTSLLDDYKANGYKGIRIILKWFNMQPTENDLDFDYVKNIINNVVANELEMELQVWVGYVSPIVEGKDWLAREGVATFMTTGGNIAGPWPDYYDPDYMQAFNRLHRNFANFLNDLPPSQKQYVKSVFISNGATGDPTPIKGTAPNQFRQYNTEGSENEENAQRWDAYIKVQWDSCWKWYAQNFDFMTLTFNPNNQAQNLGYCLNRFPGCILKHGDATHQYPVNGELYKLNWPRAIYIGELDDAIKNSPEPSNHFQCIRSALSLKTGRVDIFDDWLGLPQVPIMVDFFHKYVNQFDPATANKGFCALAQKIDFLDSVNYPIDQFGRVFLDQSKYWGGINNINNSEDDTLRKQMRYSQWAKNSHYPPRIEAFRSAGYFFTGEVGLYYINDIGWYVKDNYSLNVNQLKIKESTTGLFRIDRGKLFGRNARIFKLYSGEYKMYFDIDDRLKNSNANDRVTVKVTYRDVGTGVWKIITYQAGAKTVTNRDTNQWMQATITVNNFQWGGKMKYGADVILQLMDGNQNFPVDMIEVVNESK